MTLKRSQLLLFFLAILLGGVLRALPHIPNAIPLFALIAFVGRELPRVWALIATLIMMLIPDVYLASQYPFAAFGDWTFFTYSGALVIALCGAKLRQVDFLKSILAVSGLDFAFWLWTNLGTLAFSGLYPHTWLGFLSCYALAIPFLKVSLISNLIGSSLLFGLFSHQRLPEHAFFL